jgi:hypothetical protein
MEAVASLASMKIFKWHFCGIFGGSFVPNCGILLHSRQNFGGIFAFCSDL